VLIVTPLERFNLAVVTDWEPEVNTELSEALEALDTVRPVNRLALNGLVPVIPAKETVPVPAVKFSERAPFVVPVMVRLSPAPPAVVTATLLARVTAPVNVMGPLPEVVLW